MSRKARKSTQVVTTIELDPAQIVAAKKKVPSSVERGEDGKIVRKGKNLSGNTPYRAKNYFFDPAVTNAPNFNEALTKAPRQVQSIVTAAINAGFTTPENSARGGAICQRAIDDGILVTKIQPNVLFAYYRRVFDHLGLKQA